MSKSTTATRKRALLSSTRVDAPPVETTGNAPAPDATTPAPGIGSNSADAGFILPKREDVLADIQKTLELIKTHEIGIQAGRQRLARDLVLRHDVLVADAPANTVPSLAAMYSSPLSRKAYMEDLLTEVVGPFNPKPKTKEERVTAKYRDTMSTRFKRAMDLVTALAWRVGGTAPLQTLYDTTLDAWRCKPAWFVPATYKAGGDLLMDGDTLRQFVHLENVGAETDTTYLITTKSGVPIVINLSLDQLTMAIATQHTAESNPTHAPGDVPPTAAAARKRAARQKTGAAGPTPDDADEDNGDDEDAPASGSDTSAPASAPAAQLTPVELRKRDMAEANKLLTQLEALFSRDHMSEPKQPEFTTEAWQGVVTIEMIYMRWDAEMERVGVRKDNGVPRKAASK